MKELVGGRRDGTDVSPVVGMFLRGLSVGALVGAALAGSALLQRRRREARVALPGRSADASRNGHGVSPSD